MPLRICCAMLLAVLLQANVPAAEPVQKWTVDGVEREGLVYAPESAKTETAPVIFSFHGHGGTMQYSAKKFGFHKLWPEAIVIYLQGLNTPGRLSDPEGKQPGWQGNVGEQGDRDLKLFDAVLKWTKETYKVDDKRIYCTGHSNGGAFTYLLWAARGDTFAAVAPACAPGLRFLTELKAKPLLQIASVKDPIVKYEWVERTIDSVLKTNGCDAKGKTQGLLTVYDSATGNPVETYLYDGGHTPPPEAWDEVVKFFKEHPGK